MVIYSRFDLNRMLLERPSAPGRRSKGTCAEDERQGAGWQLHTSAARQRRFLHRGDGPAPAA